MMKLFGLKQKSIRAVKEGFIPGLSGSEILQKHSCLVEEINQLVSVPPGLFEEIYKSTLIKLAEICQSMPMAENNEPYSLFISQCRLSVALLKLRRGLILPAEVSVETAASQEPLWTYVFFLVGLFFKMERLQHNRHLLWRDEESNKEICWHPLMTSSYQAGWSYCIVWKPFFKSSRELFITSLIKEIVPVKALQWLLSVPNLFEVVIETLLQSSDTFLSEYIQKAVQHTQYPLHSMNKGAGGITTPAIKVSAEITTFSSDISSVENDQANEWALFLSWLTGQCQLSSELSYLRTPKGLFITQNIFNEFIHSQDVYENTLEFLEKWKTHFEEENQSMHFRFRPKVYEDRRILEGVIIKEEVLDAAWRAMPLNEEFTQISFI